MTTLDDMLDELTPADRAHVEARSQQLIMEERALQTLRKAKKLSQSRMAEMLGMRQDSVSRLERRSDLLISTLRSYIEAMGGSLKLMVDFPGQPSLFLDSLNMKAVKTAPKPSKAVFVSCSSKGVHHCFPTDAANLNVLYPVVHGKAPTCLTESDDTVIVVGMHAGDHKCVAADLPYRAADRGFSVHATLGSRVAGYRDAADKPWCPPHLEPA